MWSIIITVSVYFLLLLYVCAVRSWHSGFVGFWLDFSFSLIIFCLVLGSKVWELSVWRVFEAFLFLLFYLELVDWVIIVPKWNLIGFSVEGYLVSTVRNLIFLSLDNFDDKFWCKVQGIIWGKLNGLEWSGLKWQSFEKQTFKLIGKILPRAIQIKLILKF